MGSCECIAAPYFLFLREQRKLNVDTLPKTLTEATKVLSHRWRSLLNEERQRFESMHEEAKITYAGEMQVFQERLEEFYKSNPSLIPNPSLNAPKGKKFKSEKKPRLPKLYNKVVSIDPEETPYGAKYRYYYVLTYLPDLQWCHLCPMITRGKFEESMRDKFVLVNEDDESEIDVSATLCKLVKAKAMRRTQDADKEEWVIDFE